MKDAIKDKNGLDVLIMHKGVREKSKIFCDKIVYIHDRGMFEGRPVFDHHLMFWNKGMLVFKIWLPNEGKDKEFNDIYKALESVKINVLA